MKTKGIIKVENVETGEIVISATSHYEAYEDYLIKRPDAGIPNKWVAEKGLGIIRTTMLLVMNDEEFDDRKTRDAKRKQYTWDHYNRLGDIVYNPFLEKKKEKGQTKITYNLFERVEGRFDRIEAKLQRMEDKIDAK